MIGRLILFAQCLNKAIPLVFKVFVFVCCVSAAGHVFSSLCAPWLLLGIVSFDCKFSGLTTSPCYGPFIWWVNLNSTLFIVTDTKYLFFFFNFSLLFRCTVILYIYNIQCLCIYLWKTVFAWCYRSNIPHYYKASLFLFHGFTFDMRCSASQRYYLADKLQTSRTKILYLLGSKTWCVEKLLRP